MSGTHRLLHQMYEVAFATYSKTDAEVLTCMKDRQVFEVTTAAAETRTLAQPTKEGLECKVVLDADGGDLTLTVTGGYNADADTSITFDAAGDWVKFHSVKVGTSYYWRVLAQEGTNAGITFTDSMSEGDGFKGTGTIIEHTITRIGGVIKTEILIDLTGCNSGDTDGDIIGKAGTANAHIGQITAAVNGTIFAGRMSCLETPAGGEPDIDLYSATEATGAEEAAVGDLTETALLAAAADWTAALAPKGLTANPAANQYLYLVASGGATNDTYTAGILLIELWGR